MKLTKLKNEIRRLKMVKPLIYKSGESRLSSSSIRNIPDNDFNMTSLLKLLSAMGCVLIVNGQEIDDLEVLGGFITSKRYEIGMSQLDLVKKVGLTPQRIVFIEKGRSYRFSSLEKYVSIFQDDSIIFSIKDKNNGTDVR